MVWMASESNWSCQFVEAQVLRKTSPFCPHRFEWYRRHRCRCRCRCLSHTRLQNWKPHSHSQPHSRIPIIQICTLSCAFRCGWCCLQSLWFAYIHNQRMYVMQSIEIFYHICRNSQHIPFIHSHFMLALASIQTVAHSIHANCTHAMVATKCSG